ncbi:uncharacterized protein EV154DRAFT_211928 [Mucor mucedo]|uniref:uncharacterized protein n=1 Tax=Mucor mucedo TaxID=29922 RepID=UPI00221F0A0E|nr:uncharacterized protein EV154DRAFT_211928 [Mucor mucedo]KAI7896606.1 hypothetical protein EV154DRAFT_211928 [Mucor mucedo]
MDYDSDSSDFHFPSDTGLAKLSSPLSFKVPESHDWALDEFMQTLSSKPCMESDNLTSFKQYIPVQQGDDDFNYGPPKLSLVTYEEKDFLTQISQHFVDLERRELHEILKGGFSLVQNDIQANAGASPFPSAHPDISWFDEALDYGHNQHNSISTLENVDFQRSKSFSPFESHQGRSTSTITYPLEEEEEEDESIIEVQHQPMEIHKPLPALPSLPNLSTSTTDTTNKKKTKGLKHKLKSKLIKTFTPTTNNNKKSFLQNTKKFITKIFPTKTSTKDQ